LYLEDSFIVALNLIWRSGDSLPNYLEPKRLRLPISSGKLRGELWQSGGTSISPTSAIPASTTALQQPEEAFLVKAVIKEIRDKLAMVLDPNPTFERELEGQSRPKQSYDFLVVGSSNASKLSDAIGAQGYKSCVVYASSWRVSPQNVEILLPRVKEAIQEMDPAVIIFQCLDNRTFYARTEDGSRTAPRMDQDGIFRVAGEVTVASRDVMYEHYNTMKPLLDLVGKCKGIVAAPLPRYVVAGCCSDPDHCSNRRYQEFEQ
jgi:hypothetical protein